MASPHDRPELNDDRLLRLSEYLDGTLDPRQRAQVEEEVAADDRLAAELAALRRLDELVQRGVGPAPAFDESAFLQESRRRRADYERARPRSIAIRLIRPLAAAAVLAFAVTAGVMYSAHNLPLPPTDRSGGEEPAPVAVVTVARASLDTGSSAGAAVAEITISRSVPREALVETGPMLPHKTLMAAAPAPLTEAPRPALDDDAEALF